MNTILCTAASPDVKRGSFMLYIHNLSPFKVVKTSSICHQCLKITMNISVQTVSPLRLTISRSVSQHKSLSANCDYWMCIFQSVQFQSHTHTLIQRPKYVCQAHEKRTKQKSRRGRRSWNRLTIATYSYATTLTGFSDTAAHTDTQHICTHSFRAQSATLFFIFFFFKSGQWSETRFENAITRPEPRHSLEH